MPKNFPEVWKARVIALLTTLNVAPWLRGIPELDTDIIEIGSGSASESNVIHLPVETFSPEVLVNNTTYPIALQSFDDDEVVIKLDKYQTKVTTLSDDQIIGASYNRIDSATRGHIRQINATKYKKAIHAIAPSENTSKTPIVNLIDFGLDVFDAMVALKGLFDKADVPVEGRRIVLCPDHYNALIADRKRFGDLLGNMNSGETAPIIAGFEVYQYLGTPTYGSDAKKKAFGAIPANGDQPASVAFWMDNIAMKTGMTKQYFKAADEDPENQTNKLNYRHYFIAMPAKPEAIGAIVGAAVANVESVDITNGSTMIIEVDQEVQLNVAFTPSYATNQSVVFTSSDPSKATVTGAGKVKGIAAGTATVTVTSVDGGKTDTISITVEE